MFLCGYSGFSSKKYSPQRPSAAKPQPKNRNISRKDAKAAKKKTILVIRTWRSSRLGGKNIRIRDTSCIGNLRKPRKLSTIVVRSSQRSEYFLIKNSFTPRLEPVLSDVEGRLRGAISESCFTGKPEDPTFLSSYLSLRKAWL
jgi:hypothetical protein